MTPHTKLALFVAPFLILGGYILTELYLQNEADELKYFELRPEGNCDVFNRDCILVSGDFKINVYDEQGETWVNATFPLDRVTVFLVDSMGQASEIPMEMGENPFYWHRKTPLRVLITEPNQGYGMRIVAEIRGGRYFGEFYTLWEGEPEA